MTTDDSPEPANSGSLAERLVGMAEDNPKVRAQLIERWARADAWTEREGIALAWTLDPNFLAEPGRIGLGLNTELPKEASHYLDLAFRNTDFSRGRLTPSKFIAWAQHVGVAFHRDWHQATTVEASRSEGSQTAADQKRKRLIAHWAFSPYWSPAEGAVLAYDLDPKEELESSATGYKGPKRRTAGEACLLWDHAFRAVEMGGLEENTIPIVFMRWAQSVNVEFHADWWRVVADPVGQRAERGHPHAADPRATIPELKTREKESLLSLVIGMAVEGYRWDPKAPRNTATADIANDLEKAGVGLDSDTILKWLRHGAELLPGDKG